MEICFGETGEAWKRLLRALKERGLSGVEVATSDAHEGLRGALAECIPGVIWQRCQAHFRLGVLDRTPTKLKDQMHEMPSPDPGGLFSPASTGGLRSRL